MDEPGHFDRKTGNIRDISWQEFGVFVEATFVGATQWRQDIAKRYFVSKGLEYRNPCNILQLAECVFRYRDNRPK